MKNDKYVTVTQLASEYAGCSRQYIHQLMNEKKIKPDMFLGGVYLFTKKKARMIHDKFFSYVPLNQ